MKGMCMICDTETDDIIHLPLYVIGSEGLWVCLKCRIILTEFVRGLMQTAARTKLNTIKKQRKKEQEELNKLKKWVGSDKHPKPSESA